MARRQETMPGDSQELWLCSRAPTRLAWPPGGVRQLAFGPQLLTVSGAPLHGLWLCLIEDQGYGRRRPSSRARTVCMVVHGGLWQVCAKDVGVAGAGLGWRWSLVWEDTKHVDRVGMERAGRGYGL